MHDRHAGEPVTIQPAYGADSASDASEQAASSGEEGGEPHRLLGYAESALEYSALEA